MDTTLHAVPRCPAYEYFCPLCHQLRLSCAQLHECGNCGYPRIVRGEPGTLNKAELVKTHGLPLPLTKK